MTGDLDITLLSAEALKQIKHLSSLRYTISQIATIMMIPVEELRRRIANPDDAVSMAYHSGKLESQEVYRRKVKESAEKGCEWAIILIEKWNQDQLEEELGCHG